MTKKNIKITTPRLIMYPKDLNSMIDLYNNEQNIELKQAYYEMIQEIKNDPDNYEFGTNWTIELLDGTCIGGIGFKGKPDRNGIVEIGYGINKGFENQGYTTEAVCYLIKWCKSNSNIVLIYAQTEISNIASQKVLLKNGFKYIGMGNEGLLFQLKKGQF